MTLNTLPITQGKLWLIATPLGNADDLSPRARACIEEVDFLLAEDTKRAGLALQRWSVKAPRIFALNEQNEKSKIKEILEKLTQGACIGLISDAGMPVISDPGYLLVKACREAGIFISVIPGACAPVTALAGSGISPLPFAFLGFLPRADADKEKTLNMYTGLPITLIFFERKDRLLNTLKLCHALLGNRDLCIARELTKTHEEYIVTQLNQVDSIQEKLDNLLGEITVILGQPLSTQKSTPEEIDTLIEQERKNATSPRNLAKRVQTLSQGWKTGDIYIRI